MLRWRLTRERWYQRRRDDIELVGVADCLPVLGQDTFRRDSGPQLV
jgi:hypothetical protein